MGGCSNRPMFQGILRGCKASLILGKYHGTRSIWCEPQFVWCKACRRQQETVWRRNIVAMGQDDAPLVNLKWRCMISR